MLLTSNKECNIKLGHNKLHKHRCIIGTSMGEGSSRPSPDKTKYLKTSLTLSTKYWKNVIRLVIYKDYNKSIGKYSASGEKKREGGVALGWTPRQELAIKDTITFKEKLKYCHATIFPEGVAQVAIGVPILLDSTQVEQGSKETKPCSDRKKKKDLPLLQVINMSAWNTLHT